jgi:deoxyribodipyrimidine photo-lyase
MHLNPKVSQHKPFKDSTKNIVWKYDEQQFKAWCEGQTGFPIIDAAMRQLKHEGWMHNRLRMVVAMFFTKNMFHDWRLGEKFFMENLIDGDFSSNNGGWQWSASTGTDAAPYFRIFNPISQSEKFDKSGAFIRRYVPELKDLNSKEIHSPIQGLLYPEGYPRPMLDLKETRLLAIETFKNHKDI